jgi:uncharacterized protein YecE (DUF72 family)
MSQRLDTHLQSFHFRNLHPQICIGTASDRYAGWLNQIYSQDRYQGRITKRTKIIAGKSFIEEVLPVDSVEEYFEHFSVLEIDITFYRPLLDQHGQPTQNYQVLKTYTLHLKDGDRIILKVPQMVTAHKIRRGDQHVENPAYLNPKIFTEQFYEPAVNLLGAHLTGFIFEQEYQRKEDRTPVNEMAHDLDKLFQMIPKDNRYHLELRTNLYLRDPVFEILEKHGVGQILSQWTWLPPLRKQLAKASGRFFNAGNQCVIRLLTPLGMRYEDSYLKAHPFDRLIEGMLQPGTVLETVEIMRQAMEKGITVNVIVNNRAGGNAPLIAQEIVKRFLPKPKPLAGRQLNLWEL